MAEPLGFKDVSKDPKNIKVGTVGSPSVKKFDSE